MENSSMWFSAIVFSALFASALFFLFALINFFKANRDKTRYPLYKGFHLTGHGFLILGLLQMLLSLFVNYSMKGNTMISAVFFCALGLGAHFISSKMRVKP